MTPITLALSLGRSSMRLTPLDIQQKRFERGLRGYTAQEVEAFLELVASEFEEVIKENIGLKDELRRKDQRLAELADRERALQETMVTAQRITDDLKHHARKEAELVVSEAELQADKLVHAAQSRVIELNEEIGELKRQRAQFEAQVRQVVEGHLKLLEAMRPEPGAARGEDKIAFLSKKTAGREG